MTKETRESEATIGSYTPVETPLGLLPTTVISESDCTKHRPANDPQEWDSDHRSTIDLTGARAGSRKMLKGGRKRTKQRREHETGAIDMAPALQRLKQVAAGQIDVLGPYAVGSQDRFSQIHLNVSLRNVQIKAGRHFHEIVNRGIFLVDIIQPF